MDFAVFFKVAFLTFVLLMAVGPVCLTVINITVSKGFVSGLFAGLGVVLADFLFITASVLALDIASNTLKSSYVQIFPFIGSLFLFYISYIFWKNSSKNNLTRDTGFRTSSNFKRTLGMFILTISSPTTTITYATLFSGFVGLKNSSISLLLGGFTGTTTFYIVLISVLSLVRMKINDKVIKWVNRFSSITIFVFAVVVLYKTVGVLFK